MKRVPHFVARFYGRIGTAGCSQNERLLPNKEFVYAVFNSSETISLLSAVTLLTITFFSQFARNACAKSALPEQVIVKW